MSVTAFLDMTPKEFYFALNEHSEHEKQVIEASVIPICEAIRYHAFQTINIQLPRGQRYRSPKQLWTYHWDKQVRQPQTKEEMVATMKAIAKLWPNKKKKSDGRRR